MLNIQYLNINHPKPDSNGKTARTALYEMGIKSSYDDKRIIYYCGNKLDSKSNFYMQEANGLILEQNTNKVLMVPTRTLRYRIDTEMSNKYLFQGLYHVYRVFDGTCLNLYYYNNRWTISTTKGFDMNGVKYGTDKSFQEIFCDCLCALGFGDNSVTAWEDFTEQLNKTRCYTFIVRHPALHKFLPELKVYYVQSVCLDEKTPDYLWASVGPLVFKRDIVIPPQERYVSEIKNIKELYHMAANSLDSFLKGRSGPVYGFILRSINVEITKTHSDLYIESRLLQYIKKTWYNNKFYSNIGISYPSEKTVVAHAVLSQDKIFTAMFPQFAELYKECAELVKNIVECAATGVKDNPKANLLVNAFDKKIKRSLSDATPDEKIKIYTEYIMHPDNLLLLL